MTDLQKKALAYINSLSVTYEGDGTKITALSEINLELKAGERLAIIGESGSGKSTLALALAGLLPHTASVSGTIEWDGFDHLPQGGRDIGFIFQDPSASLDPVMPIGKQIAEVAKAHLGLGWRQAYSRARELLERVRIPDPDSAMHAFPHQFSGGQRQRTAIAAAIAAGPRLLIADEATSALDTIVQAEIVSLIRRLVAEDGMALLFVTHDIALAANLAERIAVFRHGELVELGDTEQVISAPRSAYAQTLLDAHIGLGTKPLLLQSRA
ncbi:ABC transporter ATP-binding protein [Mesorhizobium sp. A623]